jgi:hypothetical protein
MLHGVEERLEDGRRKGAAVRKRRRGRRFWSQRGAAVHKRRRITGRGAGELKDLTR